MLLHNLFYTADGPYHRAHWFASLAMILLLVQPVSAEDEPIVEEPIAVRDFIPHAGRWEVGVNYLYTNNQTTGIHSGGGIGVNQTTETDIDTVQANQSSTDLFILTPSVNYGLTKDTEIGTRLSWLAYQTRIQNDDAVSSESDNRFASASLSLNHRFIKEKDRPALFGSLDLTLAEHVGTTNEDVVYGRGLSLGLTAYKVFDPILMSGAIGYQRALERKVDGQTVDPGDAVYLNGGINFVPNSDTSLAMGFTWSYKGRDTIDGNKQGIAITTTSLNFGFGYEWALDTLVFLSINTVISGGEGAAISLSTNYTL